MNNYSMQKAMLSKRTIGVWAISLSILSACGGGGGSGAGVSTDSISASTYKMAVGAPEPSSIFYGGATTLVTVKLTGPFCPSSSNTTSDINKFVGGACESKSTTAESVNGRIVSLSVSDANAVSFIPSQAITNNNGEATFTLTAKSATIAGTVSVTASTSLGGYPYRQSVALKVNSGVTRTINAGDAGFFTDLGTLASCASFNTAYVNVANAAGVAQSGSIITLDATRSSSNSVEYGIADQGTFPDVGKVWFIQTRPQSLVCDTNGTDTQQDEVWFNVNPGDGSATYSIGYRYKYKIKKAA